MTPSEIEKSASYKQIESALDGLLYQSESDHPLEFVCWEKQQGKALDSSFVCEQLGKGANTNVEKGDAKELLDNCSKIETWFGEDEKKSAEGYKTLHMLLNQHLQNLRLFRIGAIEVTLVVVGEDENNLVGFKTISIET